MNFTQNDEFVRLKCRKEIAIQTFMNELFIIENFMRNIEFLC